MFGRSGELTTLMAAWASTRDGHGRVVLITGEGGIGKTRLVSELARRVAGVGARVAVGAGVDVGGEAPLAVWQELATELVAAVPEPPSGAAWPAELGRLGPDLAAALGAGGAPPPVAAPELERLRIFDAVLRLIEWAAGDRPVLLVAEDVHRADRASLALCTHIGRRLTGLPVLFLLTRRDRPTRPETDALLTDLAGRGVDVEEIELGPLTEAELGAVTRSVAALAEDDVHRVVAAAEGNPLLAVERARALAAGSTALPSSLRAAVRAAIGPLSRPARELADALAAAGRALSAPEIDALALLDRVDAERQVLESGLVRRDGGGMHFRHALLAEAAREDLVDPERNHEQVGLAIEKAAAASGDRVAAEVARHLQQAGRPDLAGSRWRRAAAHARSLGALPEAAAFWREAAACAPHDPEPWLQLAEVHGWLGRREDFEQAWSDAIAVVPEPDRWAAWCRRGNILSAVLCHPSAALAAFRTAWELLPAGAPAAVRADVLAKLAQVATSAEPHVAAALLDQVAELDPTPRSDVHAARLLLLVQQGRFEDLEEAAAAVGAANEQANRPDEWWAGLLTAASGLAAGGRIDAALRVTDRALLLARGVPVLALPCLAARAHLLSRLSRHEEAMAAAHEQLVMAERLDSPAFAALASNDAGLVALAAGHHAEAAALLGAALDGQARISRPASRLARAEALARSGEPDEATAELRRAALEPVGAADQPWALVPRMARVQGLVALARGEAAEARLRFGEAAAGWRRRRRPAVGGELMASLVDLGRPPVVGLVEPDRELARLQTELDAIAEEAPGCLASP
jgi:tetratricopeptide (TPR) repeat protein